MVHFSPIIHGSGNAPEEVSCMQQTAYEDLTICSSHSNDDTLSLILQLHYGPILSPV